MEVDEETYKKYMKILIKNGKVSEEMLMMFNYEALSDIYGWMPDEIDKQDSRIMDIYMAILAGKAQRRAVNTREMKKLR